MVSKYLQEDLVLLAEELDIMGFGNSTFLITGATGLIGSLFVRSILKYNELYADKITVYAMARNKEKAVAMFEKNDNLHLVIQDICDPITNIDCDYVVHTANSTNSKEFIDSPVEVIDSIYRGSKNVLEFCTQKKVKSAVYLSSMEVFGIVDSEKKLSEKDLGYLDIHNVRSCYSEGKRLVECMIESYVSEYSTHMSIARLAQTFGAGVSKNENRVFAQFARSAKLEKNIVLHTEGRTVGNYVYTRDAINAIMLLLNRGVPGNAYTIVNENCTMSIRHMAELVADTFSNGKSKVIFDIPENNTFGYAPVTKMHLSAKKIMQLGWKPEVGLRDMYQRMMPDIIDDSHI